MKPGILGKSEKFSIIVTEDMVPSFDGEIVHHVMSTVTMIYYMEKVGRYVILPYFEEHEEGAGFEINVKHVGPAVIGQTVTFQATCTEVRGKRVICEVTAHTSENQVGVGIFTQAVFVKQEMAERLSSLQKKVAEGESA
ncbi:thioesterase family protein [Brevibacillus daliensis]|uniref:thioesterase family protein n=1 Tax=Brevibacillus daliensis TaxID=2892995 RepID=UPI001E4E8624|nr:hotdog domain-containing protein [Brevibacillus daliensis]